MKRHVPFSVLLTCFLIHVAGSVQAQRLMPSSLDRHYTLQDLGQLPGIWPQSINNRGQIVGTAATGTKRYDEQHAFLYDPVSGFRDLGSLGGNVVRVLINDSGMVAGLSYDSTDLNRRKAWYVTKSSPAVPFKKIVQADHYWPLALNNQGVLVGSDVTGPFLLVNGKQVRLPGLDVKTLPYGVNDLGQIAGMFVRSDPSPGFPAPFLWQVAAPLTLLLGLPAHANFPTEIAWSMALNNTGWVVGINEQNSLYTIYYQAFRWQSATGAVEWLGQFSPGMDETVVPTAINDRGETIGWSQLVQQETSGRSSISYEGRGIYQPRFFVQAEGTLYDLSEISTFPGPTWSLIAVVGINIQGDIACLVSDGVSPRLGVLHPDNYTVRVRRRN